MIKNIVRCIQKKNRLLFSLFRLKMLYWKILKSPLFISLTHSHRLNHTKVLCFYLSHTRTLASFACPYAIILQIWSSLDNQCVLVVRMCIYIRIQKNILQRAYVHICICKHAYTYMYICVNMYIYICICIYMNIHIYIYIYTNTYTFICICLYVYL